MPDPSPTRVAEEAKETVTARPSSRPATKSAVSRPSSRAPTASSAKGKKGAKAAAAKKKAKITEDPSVVRRLCLHTAANNVEAVRHIVTGNAEASEPRFDWEAGGCEALAIASERGHAELVQLLIEHGANINACSGRALQRACNEARIDTAAALLASGAEPAMQQTLTNFTPAMICAMKLSTPSPPPAEVVMEPLASPQSAAATQLVTSLSPSSRFLSPRSSIPPLPSHTASLAISEQTSSAPAASPVSLLKLLLSYPSVVASLNLRCSGRHCGPYNDWTALHFAADTGNIDIARLLIEAGADIEVVNAHGDTPLTIACERGNSDMVQLLVNSGAIVHASRRELTAVDWCLYRGEYELVEFLVSHGAKPNLPCRPSWFPPQCLSLEALMEREMSEALYDQCKLAIYRGNQRLRHKTSVCDKLIEVCWDSEGGGGVGSLARGSVGGALSYLPHKAVQLIAEYTVE